MSSFDLVITGGRLITARGLRRADVAISGQRIAAVRVLRAHERRRASRRLEADGCLVLPGAIDAHVHFDLPIGADLRTADDFNSGTRAALAGGVTTVIDYTTPQPGQRPLQAFRQRRQLAERAVRCDYGLHNVLIGWREDWRRDLRTLAHLGAPSVKLFMIYAERGWQSDDGQMFSVLQACRDLGLLVCVHAENDALIRLFSARYRAGPVRTRKGALGLAQSRPPLVEEEAVARAIRLASAAGAHLHLVHLSTADAARQVGAARRSGLPISGETCPQYLTLTSAALARANGHRFACCPPLRSGDQVRGLWWALRRGWLSAVTTDHCTFNAAQKDAWGGELDRLSFGLPGVETALRLTYTLGPFARALSLVRWQALHTSGPARLFGLYPRKGALQPGSDADLVVFDPDASARLAPGQLETRCDWSPYAGRRLQGAIRLVLLRGRLAARDGRTLDSAGPGRFVPRASW